MKSNKWGIFDTMAAIWPIADLISEEVKMIILTTIDILFMNFSFGKKYSTVVKIPVRRSLHIIFKFLRALHDWDKR